MPLNYSRKLAGKTRTADGNRQLGFVLAFVAGAMNAGGFLAVHQYTSHMTGIVSAMADNLALGAFPLVLAGLGALVAFLVGSACSAILVNYSRHHDKQSEYALPLLVEAGLLLCFGLLGAKLAGDHPAFVAAAVPLLSFMMGLQNAVITKLSSAVIRTTHVTGIITDIGIELGRLVYGKCAAPGRSPEVTADRDRLGVLTTLAACFFLGGVCGAWSFKRLGYLATVPLALMLMLLVIVPVADDLTDSLRRRKETHRGSSRGNPPPPPDADR